MGLHTGTAEVRDGDYYGTPLNRAARLMAVANGVQIVCSHATADLARDSLAEGVVLTDLGEHRLRDLSRPEQVFQVHASDLTAKFAPLRSIDSFPGNLPFRVSSFIGRERELARTVEALREARVVTLTGVGGVGKTRLAYQVAGQVLPRYRDGAWLVELAPVRDLDGVVDVFASVFGVTAQPGLTVAQSLIEFFRAKQLLLVIDNCEHVLEAVADLVEQIERSCARVAVLATSREGLARLMSVGRGGQVLVSSATEGLVRDRLPEGCELVSLGEHRLRDLGRAEVVFQVVHRDLQREFAALRTVDAFPGNLPVQVSSFVGRDEDLVRVADALDRSPVVTLTGVGGVGKTRLAYQVAADVLPRFPDGAWLCELAAVRDPAAVVDAVAAVFRVTARPGMTLVESLVAYLRDQQLLLVLDNCEHLLRPIATLVAALEVGCPKVRVLATSREGLNVRGEQILVVPSLGLPDDAADLGALAECEAVRLFVDRARAVKADFVVDLTNAEGIAQVCRRLDGMPLAIELAAARVGAMNPGELARRLDRRFRLLTGGERVAIERHQTLRATIDWSYDLLDESEQRLLDRLSVFAGGCTLDAVEAVCAGDPIDRDDGFDLLANLVARSLVDADDTGLDTRYRLLETIRQYGEERLAEHGETDALRARHCDHYTELAGLVQAHSWGPGQVEWGARLAREHDNLLAAMAFALDIQDVERALELLGQLPVAGMQVNDVVVFDPDPVLALPGAAEHPGFAVALMNASWLAESRGDGPRALNLCDEALAAEQRLGPAPDAHLAMAASALRANVATDAGAFEVGAEYYVEAAGRARADELPALAAVYLAAAQGVLSWVDPAAARGRDTEALDLARRTGQPFAIASALLFLAQALAADEPDRARALLDEALHQATTLDYEHPTELAGAVFTAARLEAWPIALRVASRALHHQLRSGGLPLVWLAGILNLVARAIAEPRPEPAAVLQGAVSALVRHLVPSAPAPGDAPAPDASAPVTSVGPLVAVARRDTTRIVVAALGDGRVRELRAEGEAMDLDQAYVYARAHIDEHFAMTDEPS
jgi:predicted ATPase